MKNAVETKEHLAEEHEAAGLAREEAERQADGARKATKQAAEQLKEMAPGK